MAALLRHRSSKRNEEIIQDHKAVNYGVQDYVKTFQIPTMVLKLVGLRLHSHHNRVLGWFWNAFYWFEFANLLAAMVLELANMAATAGGRSFHHTVQIFRMMPCVGYLLLAMSKSYKIVMYRPIYSNLVTELQQMWPTGPVGKAEHQILSKALRQLNFLVQGYYWCNNALLVIFLSPPFVELLKRAYGQDVPLILPFFYWFPFDPFQRGFYETILALQTWHGLITIWLMLCGDLLFCIFLSHITTQFDLLSVKIMELVYVPVDRQLLRDYPLGIISKSKLNADSGVSTQWYHTAEWERRHQHQLTQIIHRHRALIRLAGDVEELFSFALLMNLFNSSVILCFCGFCCVIIEKWNEMVYKTFLMTALMQMWLICWYGQRLLDSSEAVSQALYNSGWYNVSGKARNTILIMILRAQKQVRVTTYGYSVLSLSTYSTIIKTSWSYFTLLLNIYKRNLRN